MLVMQQLIFLGRLLKMVFITQKKLMQFFIKIDINENGVKLDKVYFKF